MASAPTPESNLYLLAIPAVLMFSLAAMRVLALRGYRGILDEQEPARFSDSEVRGRYGDREAGVGFAASDYRERPAFVQVWVATRSGFRMHARRRSAATNLRRFLGAVPDQETGSDELDRRFYFGTDRGERLRLLATRIEFTIAMTALADLGVDDVLLEAGALSARKRSDWFVPMGSGRARETLESLGRIARAIETEFPEAPTSEFEPPPAASSVGRLVAGGLFFLSLVIGALIVGAFWEPVGWLASTRPERWALMMAHLPAAALTAFSGGMIASLLVRRSPLVTALILSWPVLLNAALVWTGYAVASNVHVAEVAQELESKRETIDAMLTSVSQSAVAVFGSGFFGSLIAGRARLPRGARP